MPALRRPTLSERIEWVFSVQLGALAARYGILAGDFYKQVLPGGTVVDQVYPPRKIPKEHFDLAARQQNKQ